MRLVARLAEVAKVQMGNAPPGSSYNELGLGMPMIAGAGDYGAETPEPKKWTIAPSRVAKKGDLIVCVRATIGDLNWADKDYCLGRGVAGIRAVEGVSDIRYLAHFIRSQRNELIKLGTGSTFLAIRRDDLEGLSVSLPPLEEQKRIAAILDKADAIRKKRQQAIELADQFLKSVFLDMFGDPVTNPLDWPVKPLSDFANVITGYPFRSGHYVDDEEGAVRLCRGANVLTGYLDWSDAKFYPITKVSGLEDYEIHESDIVLAMDRPWISSGLKISYCHGLKNSYLVQRVARIRPVAPILGEYLYHFIDSDAFTLHCKPTETTVPHISPTEIKSFEMFDVPKNLLQKFSAISKATNQYKRKLRISEKMGLSLAASLSQSAFIDGSIDLASA